MDPLAQEIGAPSCCPLCGNQGNDSFVFLETYHDALGDKDYHIHRCPACNFIFAHPFKHPGDDWYEKFSSEDSYEGIPAWRFNWFLSLRFKPGGRLLDVGCGTGNFLELARSAGYRALGVDSNPEAVMGVKAKGLEIYEGLLEEYARDSHETFDVVTMFDVLEHFDNPREMVELAHRILKPGGGLVITTPNGHRPIPFGRAAWDSPPYHLSRFTPETLEPFLEKIGFNLISSYHTYLPTSDYSCFLVNRIQALVLTLTKRLLYGSDGNSNATLTQLIQSKKPQDAQSGPRAMIKRIIKDKSTRKRLVRIYVLGMEWVLSPIFLPLKLYYRITRPKAGVTSCVLAQKA